MKLTDSQTAALERVKAHIEQGDPLSEHLVIDVCSAFGGHALTSLVGIGGTRFAIIHPDLSREDDQILKIAFSQDGIQGNRDEHRLYHEAPEPLKARLGRVGELLFDGILLEMDYYEPLTIEAFQDYNEQLDEIMCQIDLPHYEDPPYHHSFGLSNDGILMLIDYGETEAFTVKGNRREKPPD